MPLCQWDGYWFDLGPFSPYPGLRALISLGLGLQLKPSSSGWQWRCHQPYLVMQDVWIWVLPRVKDNLDHEALAWEFIPRRKCGLALHAQDEQHQQGPPESQGRHHPCKPLDTILQ